MSAPADDQTLQRSLEAALGPGKVRVDERTRHAYSTDASPCTVEPRAVVYIDSEEAVRATLTVGRELGVPLTPRAAGTSLSGAAIGPGILLDTTRFGRILAYDSSEGLVRVEPGILLSELNAFLAEHGVRFAPDPGSQDLCRIGGMLGHNASGYRSVKYGQTKDHVAALRVLLLDGGLVDARDLEVGGRHWEDAVRVVPALERLRREIEEHHDAIVSSRRPIRKHSCGYDLAAIAESLRHGVFPLASLFVGSEGSRAGGRRATFRGFRFPRRPPRAPVYLDRSQTLAL